MKLRFPTIDSIFNAFNGISFLGRQLGFFSDSFRNIYTSEHRNFLLVSSDASTESPASGNDDISSSDEGISDPSIRSYDDIGMMHEIDMPEPEPLISNDESRLNRATGYLDSLSQKDRTCPAGGSTSAEGLNDERSRRVQQFLSSLQSHAANQSLSNIKPEVEPIKGAASLGERCSGLGQKFRDITTAAHDFLDKHVGDSYLTDFVGGAKDFGSNYCEMVNANTHGVDKYYHCMANCEAANRGIGGVDAAAFIDVGRELVDFTTKDVWKDGPIKAARNVSDDMEANIRGLRASARGTRCMDSCGVLDPRGSRLK